MMATGTDNYTLFKGKSYMTIQEVKSLGIEKIEPTFFGMIIESDGTTYLVCYNNHSELQHTIRLNGRLLNIRSEQDRTKFKNVEDVVKEESSGITHGSMLDGDKGIKRDIVLSQSYNINELLSLAERLSTYFPAMGIEQICLESVPDSVRRQSRVEILP